MKNATVLTAVSLLAVCAVVAGGAPAAKAGQEGMTFFVTSVGKGSGADLGGLEGADAHCQALAKAAGSPHANWRAYLSTTAPGGEAGVNARDRIGKGPWHNARGVVVARSVEELHSDGNNVTKQTALTEKGDPISGRGDAVNTHDILTGTDPAGNYSTAGCDTTCGNWTKSGDGSAIVGSPRPRRPEGHPPHEVVELLARHGRLQPGGPGEDRRLRPLLLLRRRLTAIPRAWSPAGWSRRGNGPSRTAYCVTKRGRGMARIEGVTDERASLISRGLFWLARRKLGRVSEMWRICAHVPRIQLGRGLLELQLDSSRLVDRRLRWLGVIKTAMLVGCPA